MSVFTYAIVKMDVLCSAGVVGCVPGVPWLPHRRGLPLGRHLRVGGLPHARGARSRPTQREQIPHTQVSIRLHWLLPIAGTREVCTYLLTPYNINQLKPDILCKPLCNMYVTNRTAGLGSPLRELQIHQVLLLFIVSIRLKRTYVVGIKVLSLQKSAIIIVIFY